MVQPHLLNRLGIRYGCASPLPQRARNAGEGEVVRSCLAISGDRNDVVHVECSLLPILGEAAVFAAVRRTFNDDFSKV